MISTRDKLMCTGGNNFFVKGQVYTVGSIINQRFFEIETGSDGEYWYATKDDAGISVQFHSVENEEIDAWFTELKRQPYV